MAETFLIDAFAGCDTEDDGVTLPAGFAEEVENVDFRSIRGVLQGERGHVLLYAFDQDPFMVILVDPEDEEANVSVDTDVEITFNKAYDPLTTIAANVYLWYDDFATEYQWRHQYAVGFWHNQTGENATTLEFPSLNYPLDQGQYLCRAINVDSFTLQPLDVWEFAGRPAELVITTTHGTIPLDSNIVDVHVSPHPLSIEVEEGWEARFFVGFEEFGDDVSWQWQVWDTDHYKDIVGETAYEYIIPAAYYEVDDGKVVRCVVTTPNGVIESDSATLTMAHLNEIVMNTRLGTITEVIVHTDVWELLPEVVMETKVGTITEVVVETDYAEALPEVVMKAIVGTITAEVDV